MSTNSSKKSGKILRGTLPLLFALAIWITQSKTVLFGVQVKLPRMFTFLKESVMAASYCNLISQLNNKYVYENILAYMKDFFFIPQNL